MTDEERQNITSRFRLVIDKETTKERRENMLATRSHLNTWIAGSKLCMQQRKRYLHHAR